MAERPETQDKSAETRAREAPRLTNEEFRDTPEFRRFRRGMKKILKVSKTELAEKLRTS